MNKNLQIISLMILPLMFCSSARSETVQVDNIVPEKLVTTLDEQTAQEKKRQLDDALQIIADAKQLVTDGKYEDAEALFNDALLKIKNIGGDRAELKLKQFEAYLETFRIKWSQSLVNEAYTALADKNYDLAIIKATEAQSIKDLPVANKEKIQDFIDVCKKRIETLKYREETALTYKDVDPDNKVRNYEIDVAMKNANTLIENNQLTRARDALEKVLVRDPYNFEATEKLKKIYRKLIEVGNKRERDDLMERMSEVVWKWSEPVLPVPARRPDDTQTTGDTGTSSLAEKLTSIIMPEIDFTDANIQAVVKFLAQESKRADRVDETGVNLALGLDESEISTIPLVTMNFTNIPLSEVIRYLCQICHLKYRIDEQVVTIGNDSIDEMDTKFFKVRAALISRIAPVVESDTTDDTSFSEEDFFDPQTTFDDSKDGGGTSSKRSVTSEALKGYFEERGIPFPEGTAIAYNRRSGKLTVKNTHENLRRFDTLLRALDLEQPQVLIESKFLEISQRDMEEMGFEWWMTPVPGSSANWNITENDSLVRPLGQSKDGVGSPVSQDITSRVINNLVLPAMGTDTSFTAYNLHMMLHALDQSGTTEVLSAPKIIAKSGDEATIRMVREEYYPDSWSAPELSVSNNTFIYTPPIPEFSEATDVGIRLTVTPTVSPDNHTITLVLSPQVVQLTGWSDYSIGYIFGDNSGVSLVKMPQTSHRDISASVKTYDGDTLVLGGMLLEASSASDDSYPGSDKVPLLGFLGRMQTSKRDKRNLMIFVTARIVNPDGLPVRLSPDDGSFDFRR